MSAVTRLGLSGSTDGRPIKVAATAFSPGTTIHAAVNNSGDYDEVWLWACNTSTSSVLLTLSWGDTATAEQIAVYVPPESGLMPVIPGLLLAGGLSILAIGGSANIINLIGHVNRYNADGTPSTVMAKNKLSGSTSGRTVIPSATSTPGTTIHTAVASNADDDWDEIWLWAINDDPANTDKLTLEFGGTTSPDDLIEITIPVAGSGLTPILPGVCLQNSLVLRAFTTNTDINLHGYVNEIRTP